MQSFARTAARSPRRDAAAPVCRPCRAPRDREADLAAHGSCTPRRCRRRRRRRSRSSPAGSPCRGRSPSSAGGRARNARTRRSSLRRARGAGARRAWRPRAPDSGRPLANRVRRCRTRDTYCTGGTRSSRAMWNAHWTTRSGGASARYRNAARAASQSRRSCGPLRPERTRLAGSNVRVRPRRAGPSACTPTGRRRTMRARREEQIPPGSYASRGAGSGRSASRRPFSAAAAGTSTNELPTPLPTLATPTAPRPRSGPRISRTTLRICSLRSRPGSSWPEDAACSSCRRRTRSACSRAAFSRGHRQSRSCTRTSTTPTCSTVRRSAALRVGLGVLGRRRTRSDLGELQRGLRPEKTMSFANKRA